VWQTDGQTDGQTDRILIAIPRLHYMQRSKNQAAWFNYRQLVYVNRIMRSTVKPNIFSNFGWLRKNSVQVSATRIFG